MKRREDKGAAAGKAAAERERRDTEKNLRKTKDAKTKDHQTW